MNKSLLKRNFVLFFSNIVYLVNESGKYVLNSLELSCRLLLFGPIFTFLIYHLEVFKGLKLFCYRLFNDLMPSRSKFRNMKTSTVSKYLSLCSTL